MKQNESIISRGTAIWIVVLMLFVYSGAFAQASEPEEVHQEWRMLGESPQTIDVSARVVSCGSAKQILLNVFNENTIDQVAKFTITIKNTDGNEVNKVITQSINKMTMAIAECGNSTHNNLKIVIPNGFDAKKATLSIVFH